MNVTLLLGVMVLIVALGFGGTLWVGFSQANREGDPGYEKRTGARLIRLTLFYFVTVVIAVTAFLIFRR